ncbi:5-methylcytosine-specific restriction endonuclease subunit McrB [Pontibacter ramchanderi]|uniref:5-methylcytosine-specific restriction protein B n=1 Tax=Pontibacter ramchanderi TaxID=1179743 RepID=A0A2N3V279_9BACT|nr:DUF3578 domain-containing protein [Pontibacter ramchanderi]PKV75730.1 5-methylcytosine-specific restriction protein B [Pontibacter ramchanderi]
MSLPSNITKEHLLKAIKKIDIEGIPTKAHSSTYDVVFGGKKYPPKLVLSYANIFANNKELDRNTFEGGLDTQCFNIIENNGFKIEMKDANFFPSLIKYLSQAQTPDQKTKSYIKSFKDLRVEVSFGQGNKTWVPWLAFLREGHAVSNGIYPVFLNYLKYDVLILAFGLSDTNKPQNSWPLSPSVKTINQFFLEKFNHKPPKYGDSFVYKYYFLDKNKNTFSLNENEVEEDISNIISIYKNLNLNGTTSISSNQQIVFPERNEQILKSKIFNYVSLALDLRNAGLAFSEHLILRFAASLITKPFVILTGLSGSGKTKLVQAFARWITEKDNQLCIVPIGADWTNREPLLGFPNALDPTKYSIPENGALQLLISANENPDKPYFLILDEMNLSHVERYFADFLSAMESHEPIPLHAESGIVDVPTNIKLPKNLFIIGTVNIDETTYMFSPKVLDRANAIEFRVTESEMDNYLKNAAKLDLDKLKARGADMASDFVLKAKTEVEGFSDYENLNSALLLFFSELKKVGAEFGYRTASEIKRFSEVIHSLDAGWDTNHIIDAAIIQKLLPKLHGSRRKIEPSLRALASLCLVQQDDATKLLNTPETIDFKDVEKVRFPISLEKITRMHKAVVQDGFTSFAEA